MVVFVNKMDALADDERDDMKALIELETKALLEAQGYEKTPFVFGSALQALEAVGRAISLIQPCRASSSSWRRWTPRSPIRCGTSKARS
jgi:translation elongation factor EF-Tu-like GTPase